MSNRPPPPQTARHDTLIVVLGMHRSGTSALTRAMHVFGADFGAHLMPAVQGVNDKGFFEDLDVNTLNIELMQAMGMDWHTMAPIALDRIEPQRMARFQLDALRLLQGKCASCRILAIKDPRISRLLPFWQPVFAQLNRRVVYAIAVRNPVSVSDSLATRDHFPEEKSHLLWLAHTVPALDMTRGHQRTIISYDRLMDTPRSELERVSRELGLPLLTARLDAFEREFLDGTLRHSRHSASDVQALDSAPQQLKDLFAALVRTLRDKDAEANQLEMALGNARRYLNDVAPLLRCEWRVEQTVAEQQQRLEQIAEQHARITREHIAVLESTSWRATAVLRAVKHGLNALVGGKLAAPTH